MKKIILAILVITSLFLFVGCNFNFNYTGTGVLRIENNSSYEIKAFVIYSDDGNYEEIYRNDGKYGDSEAPNIKSNTYKDFEVDSGHYNVWFYMIAEDYWYYTEIEDVFIYYNNTTEVSVEDGNWSMLVPSKSMRNMLPEVVKNQVFATEL